MGARSKRLWATLVLPVTLVLVAFGSTGVPSWERVHSEPGRFAVDFPAAPEVRHWEQGSLVGSIASARYLLDWGALELRVEHHDIPWLASMLVSEQGMLQRAEADLVEGEGAQALAASESLQQGRTLREVHFRVLGEGVRDGRASFQLLGRRLYVQAALFPAEQSENPVLARFFDSFEAWER